MNSATVSMLKHIDDVAPDQILHINTLVIPNQSRQKLSNHCFIPQHFDLGDDGLYDLEEVLSDGSQHRVTAPCDSIRVMGNEVPVVTQRGQEPLQEIAKGSLTDVGLDAKLEKLKTSRPPKSFDHDFLDFLFQVVQSELCLHQGDHS